MNDPKTIAYSTAACLFAYASEHEPDEGQHGAVVVKDMAEIAVTRTGPERFGVEVTDGERTTTHDVAMPPPLMGDLLRLKWVDAEVVVKESFVFLLEREPASAIPPTFSLTDIYLQFPDYYDEFHRRLT